MSEVRAVKINDIIIEISDFSISKLQEQLDYQYNVISDDTDNANYCKIADSYGHQIAYIEFEDNKVYNIIGESGIDSIITGDNIEITLSELKKLETKHIKSAICNNPELDFPVYVYVENNKCYECPFNIDGKCSYRVINDWISAIKIEKLNLVIKEYSDGAIGIELKL